MPVMGTTQPVGALMALIQQVKLREGTNPPAVNDQSYISQNTGPETFPLPAPYPPTSVNDGGYLFAVIAAGTDPVDVEYLAAPIASVPVGGGMLFMFDGSALTYRVLAAFGTGGGFVNPMPNATVLAGLDTTAVARALAEVSAGDVAVLGGAVLPTAVNTAAAGGSLAVNSVNRYSWSDVLLGPLQDAARTLGSNALRWLSGHLSSFLAIGANVAASGSVRLSRTATMLVARNQANTNDVQHLGADATNNFRAFSIGDSLILAAGSAPGTEAISIHVSQAGNALLPVTGVAATRPGLGSATLGWAELCLVSPDNTVWHVTVDNTGTLVVT
jgi:hypothetical protein